MVGGFSKLIKHITEIEKPKQIRTFIDERYGKGEYLKELGFNSNKTYVSFRWTDGIKYYYRLDPEKKKEKAGLKKFFDVGQTRWDLAI